jgi:hypothetical protein
LKAKLNRYIPLEDSPVHAPEFLKRRHFEGEMLKRGVLEQGDFVRLLVRPVAYKSAGAEGIFRPTSANRLHAQNVAVECGGDGRILGVQPTWWTPVFRQPHLCE